MVPPPVADPQRIRMLTVITVATWTVGLAYAAEYARLGLYWMMAGILVAAGVAFANLILARRGGDPALHGRVMTAAFFGSLLIDNIGTGGFYDPNFGWFYLVPLVAGLVATPRDAWAFTALVIATSIAFWASHEVGGPLGSSIPASDRALHSLANRVLAVLCIGVALAAVADRDRVARERLEHSNRRLEAEIAERDALHARLLRSERLATMGELSAAVAHEINNPLSYVMTNLELLEGSLVHVAPQERARFGEMVAEALDGSERVRDIVANLKTTTREPSVDLLVPLRLGPVVDRASKLVGRMLSDRARLEVTVDTAPEVMGQEGPLIQILVNLLANAAQATPDGGPDTHVVWVRAWGELHKVVLEVQDGGAGFDEAVLDRVFDPFFTTKRGSGTGLGLSITRSLVEQMGGTIRAQNAPEGGALLRVDLQRAATVTTLPPAVGLRVLVIDDEPLILSAVRRALAHHQTTTVSDPHEGLAHALREPWDVIFCDVMMPGLSGLELYVSLQRERPESASRTVFITGAALGPAEQTFIRRPEVRVLHKPLEVAALQDTVDAVVRAHGRVSAPATAG